jgi:ABC-type Na+ transport system ATPase subunit NatA
MSVKFLSLICERFILLVSHLINYLEPLCDEIVLFRKANNMDSRE